MTPTRMATLASAMELGPDFARYDALTERYRNDAALRKRLAADDAAEALVEFGVELPRETRVKCVENTQDDVYFVMPANPNALLSDEDLRHVTGGSSLSSAFCFGSAGSLPSCVSSVGSASTGGTAGP